MSWRAAIPAGPRAEAHFFDALTASSAGQLGHSVSNLVRVVAALFARRSGHKEEQRAAEYGRGFEDAGDADPPSICAGNEEEAWAPQALMPTLLARILPAKMGDPVSTDKQPPTRRRLLAVNKQVHASAQ